MDMETVFFPYVPPGSTLNGISTVVDFLPVPRIIKDFEVPWLKGIYNRLLQQVAEDHGVRIANVHEPYVSASGKEYPSFLDATGEVKSDGETLRDLGLSTEFDFCTRALLLEDEIVLGTFGDEECRVAAFFHELGHYMLGHVSMRGVSAETLLRTEHDAWDVGFREAERYKVEFGHHGWDFREKCLDSYRGKGLRYWSGNNGC